MALRYIAVYCYFFPYTFIYTTVWCLSVRFSHLVSLMKTYNESQSIAMCIWHAFRSLAHTLPPLYAIASVCRRRVAEKKKEMVMRLECVSDVLSRNHLENENPFRTILRLIKLIDDGLLSCCQRERRRQRAHEHTHAHKHQGAEALLSPYLSSILSLMRAEYAMVEGGVSEIKSLSRFQFFGNCVRAFPV